MDPRPCLVLFPPVGDEIPILFMSSQGDLCLDRQKFFAIEKSDPDFAATGLEKKSFIYGERAYKVKREAVIKRIGRLSGRLLAVFKKWYGL